MGPAWLLTVQRSDLDRLDLHGGKLEIGVRTTRPGRSAILGDRAAVRQVEARTEGEILRAADRHAVDKSIVRHCRAGVAPVTRIGGSREVAVDKAAFRLDAVLVDIGGGGLSGDGVI